MRARERAAREKATPRGLHDFQGRERTRGREPVARAPARPPSRSGRPDQGVGVGTGVGRSITVAVPTRPAESTTTMVNVPGAVLV